MIKYFKQIEDGYITAIMEGETGENEITEEEYNAILAVIRSRPVPDAGYDYKLREDLTWELVAAPPRKERDLSAEEALDIMLGVME